MTNEATLKSKAEAFAAQLKSTPLSWAEHPDGTFVLIIANGQKFTFAPDTKADEETVTVNLKDGADEQEAANAGKALAAHRKKK